VQQLEFGRNPSPGSASQLTPFLKWAGGKRWLSSNYPEIFPIKFDRYIEPFLGGGAIFFDLVPNCAVLSDVNSELILIHQAIRDDWQAVQSALNRHQRSHSKIYFYEERDRIRRKPHEKGAQFLYLNRTCWNGLYRVNLQGKFNVPKGTKTNVILPTDDFQSVSNALKKRHFIVGRFRRSDRKRGEWRFHIYRSTIYGEAQRKWVH
jgi:DNA adenine methylase